MSSVSWPRVADGMMEVVDIDDADNNSARYVDMADMPEDMLQFLRDNHYVLIEGTPNMRARPLAKSPTRHSHAHCTRTLYH